MQARSIDVGIAVRSDHKKLRIRTSLPPDQIDRLITAWPDELKLKSTKAVDSGAEIGGETPIPSENSWLKYGVPVVVAFVTAASIAGSVSLKKAIWPDYKVVITSPPLDEGIAKWSSNVVTIDWYLRPDQASFRAVKKNLAATVRVHASSGTRRPVESKPPLSVTLEPGSYVIVVDAPDATPAQFQVVIEKLPSQSSQPSRNR